MYAAYTLLYLMGLCAYLPRAAWRWLRSGRYQEGLGQRLGRVPAALRDLDGDVVWIHAVSVGEVHAARGLLAHLDRIGPGFRAVLSTTTDTGQALAATAGADASFYCPFDLPWAVSAWLDALRPRAVILVETEIWPNLLRACSRRQIPVVLVNARLSASSFAGYRRMGGIWRGVLDQLSLVCARTERDAERFRSLGVTDDLVFTTGNLKADAAVLASPPEVRQQLARALRLNGDSPVLVAGCTMPGEEDQVLEAFATARVAEPTARLLLAPRHPERFDEVARAVDAAGWRCRRRTSGGPPDAEVLLLDTIGELPAAYGLGIASFVGGSLVPTGGHNLLEPAIYGQPVLFGPHMHNFADLAEEFRRQGAALEVTDADSLGRAWSDMLRDATRRRELGARARRVARGDAIAGERTIDVLARHLGWC